MKNNTILFYKEHFEIIDELSDEQIGKLFRALFYRKFDEFGKQPKVTKDIKMAYKFIENQLVIDEEKYRQRCETNKINGAKGGRPKKSENEKTEKPKGFFGNRTKPNETEQNPNDNDNDNENDNENDNVNDNVNTSSSKKPTKEEVEEFIQEENLNVDPKSFYEHYSDLEWILNGIPVNSWKTLCRTWDKNNKKPVRQAEYVPEPINDNVIPMPEDIRKKQL